MNDLRNWAAHKSGCGWMASHHAPDGVGRPCRCGLFDLLFAPGASAAAFRPYVCHDRTCAWSRSVQYGKPRAICDCGLDGLLTTLGPSSDPAVRRRETQMADTKLASPPGYQVY